MKTNRRLTSGPRTNLSVGHLHSLPSAASDAAIVRESERHRGNKPVVWIRGIISGKLTCPPVVMKRLLGKQCIISFLLMWYLKDTMVNMWPA